MTTDLELDALTLTEPLACVMHAQDKIPEYAQINSAAVYGGGPMGALHLIELRRRRPGLRLILVEPQDQRRELMSSLFPGLELFARLEHCGDERARGSPHGT